MSLMPAHRVASKFDEMALTTARPSTYQLPQVSVRTAHVRQHLLIGIRRQSTQSLHLAALESKYEQSNHTIALLEKDEDIRRLRFQLLLLEDENDDLHNQLTVEEDRGDALEKDVSEIQLREDEALEDTRRLMGEVRLKSREVETARVSQNSRQPQHYSKLMLFIGRTHGHAECFDGL